MLEIVGKFVDQDKNNLRLLQQCLANYKDIFQNVYSCTFPEIYTMSEKRGIDMKINFYILFKSYRDKAIMKQQLLAKQTENYKSAEHRDEHECEQKPLLKFNEFNDEEEKEIKEMQRKKNKKRKATAAVDNAERQAKLQKKAENKKEKEKAMWKKLDELNKGFKDIKEKERAEEKKMSTTIIHYFFIKCK